ncbi:hypothetical protein FACS1894205_4460 [Alphaproteobacteria bacterium]|nr:hypothetical protein FACS1894205_4460 [Alphaproteobacteria bacterium]
MPKKPISRYGDDPETSKDGRDKSRGLEEIAWVSFFWSVLDRQAARTSARKVVTMPFSSSDSLAKDWEEANT